MTDLNHRRADDHARITEALAAAPFAMLADEYQRRMDLLHKSRCPDCRKWLGECRCERAAVPVSPLREPLFMGVVSVGFPKPVPTPEPSRVAVGEAVHDYDPNC